MGVNMVTTGQDEGQFPAQIPRDFPERCKEYAGWLKKNRPIYDAFKNNALDLIEAGRPTFGARALAEAARYYSALRDADGEYKINNNIVGLLSRHFSLDCPQHREFFKERTMLGEPPDPVVSQAILKNALGAV